MFLRRLVIVLGLLYLLTFLGLYIFLPGYIARAGDYVRPMISTSISPGKLLVVFVLIALGFIISNKQLAIIKHVEKQHRRKEEMEHQPPGRHM